MGKSSIKNNKIIAAKTEILLKIQPFIQYQWFYLLAIFSTLAAWHLNIIRTHPIGAITEEISFYTVHWGVILYLLWHDIKQKPQLQENTPSWVASWLGLLLLFLAIIRPLHLWHLDLILFRVAPIVAGLGLGLLSFGFSGFRQHWRLFAVLCLMLFPFGKIVTILNFIFDSLLHFNDLTAAISAFLVHYVGFQVNYSGNVVTLPTGQVRVLYACTGGPVIISLLRLTLLSVVFPLSWWRRLALVISATIVGFFTGVIRVALLAIVVNNQESFDYWHGSTGGGIFMTFGTLTFACCCNWLLPLEDLAGNQPDATEITQPKIYSKRRLFLAGTWLGIMVTAIYLIANQINISVINSISLPDKLPLNQWQQTQVTFVKDDELQTDFQKFNFIKNSNQKQELEILYTLNTGTYYHNPFVSERNQNLNGNKFQKISSPVVGDYILYDEGNKASLASCINPRGGGTINLSQFIQNRYKYDFTSDRILKWVFGQGVLRDDRCLWTKLSAPLNETPATDIYPVLEAVWLENYTKWQSFLHL